MSTFRITRSLIIAGIACLLFSCQAARRLQGDVYAARDKDHKAFVKKYDGEIIESSAARLRSPLFRKSTIELDNNISVPVKEVQAYQDDRAFYFKSDMGFIPRVKKGLINMYQGERTYSSYDAGSPTTGGGGWHQNTVIIYYLQKGDSGPLEILRPQLVENYVQSYAPAMEYIDLYKQNKKKAAIWSIVNTTAVFGGLLLTSQGFKHGKVDAVGGVSIALFGGGLINGFVNKFRKAHNYNNLGLAIDEYNMQTTRKRN